MKYRICSIAIIVMVSGLTFADSSSDDGIYGYYWSAGSNLWGSTSYDAAMAECSLYASNTPSCVGVVLVSSSQASVTYRRSLSNGSTSIASVTVIKNACTGSQSSIASCQEGYGQLENCSDGLPPDLLGYPGCDRPSLKQCSDGSFVQASTGICPVEAGICSDYDTCYNYAVNDANCQGATYFEFNYINSQNWGYNCTTILIESPDHANNGGNQDGNPNNDPTSPETPTVSQIDPQTLANAIDSALQNDFGNVERVIRDGNDQADQNAKAIKQAIEDLGMGTGEGFTDLETAISQGFNQLGNTNASGASDVVNSVNGVKASTDAGNVTLAEISGKLDDLKDCEPTVENNYCENPHGLDSAFIGSVSDALQGTMDQERDESLETVKGEIDELKDGNPFGSELTENNLEGLYSFFTDIWPSPTSCIPLEIGDSSQPFGHITISCEFSDKFKAIFGFLISIYTILSLIDILMSPIKPKLNGGT